MSHPYESLPENAFWAPAIAQRNRFEIRDLWQPKFEIDATTKVVTFGSCFAQHFGAALQRRGYSWLNTERPPIGLLAENAAKFGYGVFSCRTGNIYTASLLQQWVQWATAEQSHPDINWTAGERVYDPFRPTIEPDGFCSVDEMMRSRRQTISSFYDAIRRTDVFVFTLGLTESWFDSRGWEYPMCPGTAAGSFDANHHLFVNQRYPQVRKSLLGAIRSMRAVNKKIRILLTVSPVPLTATNSNRHVLIATMYSKSVLRAVAGDLAGGAEFIDYFPSYEIINSPVFGGTFFEPNQRNVSAFGVNFVMDTFFECVGAGQATEHAPKEEVETRSTQDAICDEELLDAFRKP